MKKNVKTLVTLIAVLASALLFGCKGKNAKALTIAIPNDTTNEARALLLLQDNGYITLKEGVGITATPLDIVENPNGFKFNEVEAAQLPNVLPDVDYALINSNYALGAGLNPYNDGLLIEGSTSAYVNIIAVKKGNENKEEVKALVAAVKSQEVKDFITNKYQGSVVPVVEDVTDGYDSSVDYDSIKGKKISIAASPNPHAEILAIAKKILAAKGVELKIVEFNDYVQPNKVVDSGEIDANFFQHEPYLIDFNKENGTDVVSIVGVHVEPLALYAGKTKNLDSLRKVK
ncbi:MAG: hypothetical protein K6F15_03520 [Treponema sp.]|nr:hypothetical protein [Treponema sp.]